MDANLVDSLASQLDWHWTTLLRPRLEGLTDEEYLWEPVAGWNVRPRASESEAPQPGTGPFTIDFAFPEPSPPPVTTIAWRTAHIACGIFGMRNHSHFAGPEVDYNSYPYAGTAQAALEQLDEEYGRWLSGVRGLSEGALWRPVGPAEGEWADAPMIDLVLHITRETVHHGAEICLLRDLYLRRDELGAGTGDPAGTE